MDHPAQVVERHHGVNDLLNTYLLAIKEELNALKLDSERQVGEELRKQEGLAANLLANRHMVQRAGFQYRDLAAGADASACAASSSAIYSHTLAGARAAEALGYVTEAVATVYFEVTNNKLGQRLAGATASLRDAISQAKEEPALAGGYAASALVQLSERFNKLGAVIGEFVDIIGSGKSVITDDTSGVWTKLKDMHTIIKACKAILATASGWPALEKIASVLAVLDALFSAIAAALEAHDEYRQAVRYSSTAASDRAAVAMHGGASAISVPFLTLEQAARPPEEFQRAVLGSIQNARSAEGLVKLIDRHIATQQRLLNQLQSPRSKLAAARERLGGAEQEARGCLRVSEGLIPELKRRGGEADRAYALMLEREVALTRQQLRWSSSPRLASPLPRRDSLYDPGDAAKLEKEVDALSRIKADRGDDPLGRELRKLDAHTSQQVNDLNGQIERSMEQLPRVTDGSSRTRQLVQRIQELERKRQKVLTDYERAYEARVRAGR